MPERAAAALIRGRPNAVVSELIAGLDQWAAISLSPSRERLLDLAEQADHADGLRSELRKQARTGIDRDRLKHLAAELEPSTAPGLTVVVLTRYLWEFREYGSMETLLNAAVLARPADALLRNDLYKYCLIRGAEMAAGKLISPKGPGDRASPATMENHYFQEALTQSDVLRTLRPEMRLLYAVALLHARPDDGLKMLRDLRQEQPDEPFIHLMEAFALAKKGNFEESAKAAKNAAALAGNGLQGNVARLSQAEAALAAKDWEKVENLCREIIDSTSFSEILKQMPPNEPSVHGKGLAADTLIMAYKYLAKACDAQGRRGETIKAFCEASRILQAIPSGHVFAAQQLEKIKDWNGAEKLLIKGLQEDPENAALIVYCMQFKHWRGVPYEIEKARQQLAKASLPDDPLSLYKVGFDLLGLKEFGPAERAFRALLQSLPDHFEANVNLGSILIMTKRPDEAQEVAAKVIRVQPESYTGYWLRGWALAQQMHFADAEGPLRKAVQMNPDDAAPTLVLGEVLWRLKNSQEAEKFVRRGLRLDPANVTGCLVLGEILLARGEIAEAKEMHDKAMKLKKPGIR
jgi:tetratricopeptide (TPR) repeat protein